MLSSKASFFMREQPRMDLRPRQQRGITHALCLASKCMILLQPDKSRSCFLPLLALPVCLSLCVCLRCPAIRTPVGWMGQRRTQGGGGGGVGAHASHGDQLGITSIKFGYFRLDLGGPSHGLAGSKERASGEPPSFARRGGHLEGHHHDCSTV